MSRPLISVVIPARDREAYVGEAIESVLLQRQPSLEIVVVDDGSRDRTASIARGFPAVRCIRRDHGGAAAARNTGVEAARGELLAFLDSDDRWAPRKLERQLAALSNATGPALVLGHVEHFVSPELDQSTASRLACPERAAPGLCCGAMLLSAMDFHRVGPFDETFRVGEFIDWYARAEEASLERTIVDAVVLYRRLHAGHLDRGAGASRRDFARLLKARLDRRRARGEEA
jgi:glycosyltransferase involved in cell wall biosynthesis